MHEECVLPGNTVEFYGKVSDGFCKWIARFKLDLRKDRSCFVLQDNVPIARTTQQFLRNFQPEKRFPNSLTYSYSSNLSPIRTISENPVMNWYY